jgi:hypothetical protein
MAQDIGQIDADPALDLRLRYELFDPTAFGNGPQDDDGYWLWRIAPSVRVSLSENWTVAGQLYAAGAEGRNGGARAADRNDLDLTQAWVEWRPARTSGSFVRVGRQEIALGSGRLIAASDVSNTRRRFDGVVANWKVDSLTLVGVAASPVRVESGVFDDRSSLENTLLGAGAIWRLSSQAQAAAYLAVSRREDAQFGVPRESDRTTAGVRWVYRAGGRSVEAEVLGQSGEASGVDLSGWAFAGEVSQTFAAVGPVTPRLWVKASAASGDGNPNDNRVERFDPLFANPVYSGSIPLFGPTNLAAINPGITFNWASGARVGLDVAIMSRVEAADTAWTFAGTPIRANPDQRRGVGALWALTGAWPVNARLNVSVTAARFEARESFRPVDPSTSFVALNLNFAY